MSILLFMTMPSPLRFIPLLVLALSTASATYAAPLSGPEREATIQYVVGLRNRDGGYRNTLAPGPSTVGATSASLRALKYLGGRPDLRPLTFVNSCMKEDGGIADTPQAAPTVRSTAVGLMALVELQAALKFGVGGQIESYLTKQSRALPDIYISAAALEAAGMKAPAAKRWLAQWEATRNPDGSYGKSIADTAGAVIVAYRLGSRPRDSGKARRLMVEAQRQDGGWSADGQTSDLATVYRVMRALWMLKAKPDLARLRTYIASCRNPDGGYGPAAGQPSNASATYYAAICLHWADEMSR